MTAPDWVELGHVNLIFMIVKLTHRIDGDQSSNFIFHFSFTILIDELA